MGIAIFAYKTQGVVDILCYEDEGFVLVFLFLFLASRGDIQNNIASQQRPHLPRSER